MILSEAKDLRLLLAKLVMDSLRQATRYQFIRLKMEIIFHFQRQSHLPLDAISTKSWLRIALDLRQSNCFETDMGSAHDF